MSGRVLTSFVFFSLFAAPAAASPMQAPPGGSDSPTPAAASQSPGRESDGLRAYVERADPSYRWEVRQEVEVGSATVTELRLTSLSWQGELWKHQLFVIWPGTMSADVDHAVLFIHGGRWGTELDRPLRSRIPAEAEAIAEIAEAFAMPVAVLRQVPFQPMFGGLTEDALIAHTFERYLEEGDPEWPLLRPMVKSAVRAMDALQEVAAERHGLGLRGFTVTGGSKRGWTSWLVGAVDERARALAPISIDVLNIEAHLRHQRESWGDFSSEIADYTGRGLHEVLESEGGRALLATVDPYSYRDRLTQPKLVVVGTNDAYWPLDALNLYWDGLNGTKRILYLPNKGHRADDYPRIVGALLALSRHAGNGEALPEPSWTFEEAEGRLRLRVGADVEPGVVQAWTALAPTRDFREAHWTSEPCVREEGGWTCELELPTDGYGALFAELAWEDGRSVPLSLSTQVRIGSRAEGT